jgi:hypothetical protein
MEYEIDQELASLRHRPMREPKSITCCNRELVLYSSWANECPHCHREFNGSGQALAPRSCWGEETGEDFY